MAEKNGSDRIEPVVVRMSDVQPEYVQLYPSIEQVEKDGPVRNRWVRNGDVINFFDKNTRCAYYVDLETFKKPEELLDTLAHVGGKVWGTDQVIGQLVGELHKALGFYFWKGGYTGHYALLHVEIGETWEAYKVRLQEYLVK